MTTMTRWLALAGTIAVLSATSGFAAEVSESELAKRTQNPVANLISVPFQNNTSYEVGPRDRTQNVLNIQPVVPIGLTEDWSVITRTIFPIVSQLLRPRSRPTERRWGHHAVGLTCHPRSLRTAG